MATSISTVSSYFTGLINQLMAIESRPLNTLQTQKSELELKRSIFSDLSSKLSGLQTVVSKFADTAFTSVFDKRASTITDVAAGKTVLTASASESAITGAYSINVAADGLAREHRVRSDQQPYADQALNLSGTFVVGGAAARAQATIATIANTVTGFGAGSLDTGQKEVGTGAYFVETRSDGAAGWRFRVVNAEGKAVSVQLSDGSGYSSNWQSIPAGGGAYDTGRGLTLTFGSDSGQYQAASKSAGAAQVNYTAQGASITVAAASSLNDVADAINSGAYAEGNGVIATVVDRQLLLAAKETGTAHAVVTADSSGAVLQSLGVLTAGGAFKNPMQSAWDASFTINNISVTRSRNTGLDDVITGVTLNLAADAAGESATLTVNRDDAAVKGQVQDLLTQFNGLTAYLQDKTSVSGAGDTNATAKYARGALADDYAYSSLRDDLISGMTRSVSGLPAGSPTALWEIGITLNDNLEMSISDSTKFDTALAQNPSGVKALLESIAGRLDSRLDAFTDVSHGTLTLGQNSVSDEIESIDGRIIEMNETLADRHQALQAEYAVLQALIMNNLFTQEQLSLLGGGANFLA